MQVRVLYFGVLQELFGTAGEPVELPDGATVGALVRVLRDRTSNQAMGAKEQERLWRSIAVAVNQEYGSPGAVLREADEVALLPPVSGGRDEGKQGMSQGLKPWVFGAFDVRAKARTYLRRKSEGHAD
jgi:molybdopterin converting factor subunit 1